MMKLCRDIDANDNGELTLKELQDGFQADRAFAMHLELLGIEFEMLPEIFSIMDNDGSGSLSYEEFVDTIHKAKSQDIKMLLTMVKFELFAELKNIREDMSLLISRS